MYLQFTDTQKKGGLKSNQNRGTATEQIELEKGEIITSSDPEAAPTGSWRLPNEGSTTSFSDQPNPKPCEDRERGSRRRRLENPEP